MAKQENLVFEGEVMQELGNSMFRVSLENGHELLCTISGKIRKNYIRIMTGDRVRLEVSPYDLDRGRIITRLKVETGTTANDNNKKKK